MRPGPTIANIQWGHICCCTVFKCMSKSALHAIILEIQIQQCNKINGIIINTNIEEK